MPIKKLSLNYNNVILKDYDLFRAPLVAQQLRIWLQCEPQETRLQPLGWEDPLEEGMATAPVLLPGDVQGQRSLVGCSPWGRKESDMTEVT